MWYELHNIPILLDLPRKEGKEKVYVPNVGGLNSATKTRYFLRECYKHEVDDFGTHWGIKYRPNDVVEDDSPWFFTCSDVLDETSEWYTKKQLKDGEHNVSHSPTSASAVLGEFHKKQGPHPLAQMVPVQKVVRDFKAE